MFKANKLLTVTMKGLIMELYYKVTDSKYENVKEILLSHFHISHRLLVKLKNTNNIFLNGAPTAIYTKVSLADELLINLNYPEDNSNIVPTKMNLDIIYEDDCYIVINKPSGIPVHPSILHFEDSLSNGLRHYFNSIGLYKKIRPVNRIDKDTSGLVIFAKNEYIQELLIRQMNLKTFTKEYIAIVEGIFENKTGTINLPIARKENSIIERCVNENGDISITHYEVLKSLYIKNWPVSVLKCTLETGRTHQIRVHLSHIGHPLIGDDLYGGNMNFIKRQALHSYKISFIHPITNCKVEYTANIPNDLTNLFNGYIEKR